MTLENKKKLLKAQQGELDGVIVYRKLAELIEDVNIKEQLLSIASDEGKHASILKEYTGEVLRPKYFKSKIVIAIYKLFGVNFTLNALSKGEMKAVPTYDKLVLEFPKIKEIMNDESRHSTVLISFCK